MNNNLLFRTQTSKKEKSIKIYKLISEHYWFGILYTFFTQKQLLEYDDAFVIIKYPDNTLEARRNCDNTAIFPRGKYNFKDLREKVYNELNNISVAYESPSC